MKKILFLVSGMLVCIIILITILLVAKHLPLSTPKKTSNPAYNIPYVHPTVSTSVDTSINICTKQYPNYPLLSSILTTPADKNLGVFTGKITNVDQGQHTITVTSQTNSKSFIFQGSSINNVLYDITHAKLNSFTTVHTGMKAVVSFPCHQQPGSFVLTQFQLVL